MVKEIILFPMPGHCKILMNKFIVWSKVALFIISAFVPINGSIHLFHLCLLTCELCLLSSWSRHFPLSMKGIGNGASLWWRYMIIFYIMMSCVLGSIQLWEWGILLICYPVVNTEHFSSCDGWHMDAVCYGDAVPSWQQGGGGNEGLGNTTYNA